MELKWLIYSIVVLVVLLIVGITISILLLKSLFRTSKNAFVIDENNELLLEQAVDWDSNPSQRTDKVARNSIDKVVENELV